MEVHRWTRPHKLLFTQLVDNAREEHPLETDLVNLLMESSDEEITEIQFYLHDKLCDAFPDRNLDFERTCSYLDKRLRLGLFERKLEANDDEAMDLYDEWTEADYRRLLGSIRED